MLRNNSIVYKILLILLIFFLIQSIILTFFINYYSDKLIVDVTGNTTIGMLQIVASHIDSERYQQLAASLDINDPYYEELRQYLLQMKIDFGLEYLYTESFGSDGETVYVVDGNYLDDDGFSALGEPVNSEEEMVDTEYSIACLEDGTVGYGLSVFEGVFMISTYYPIKNSAGDVIGILGADFSSKEVKQSKNEFVGMFILVIFLFAVVLSALIMMFLRIILRPLFVLKDSIAQMGNGDLTVRIPVSTRDEIGYIINEFNHSGSAQQNMIKTVIDSSNVINNSILVINHHMSELEDHTKELLNVTNELSAASAENAASTQELSSMVQTLDSAIERIMEDSENGVSTSSKVEEKAGDLKDSFKATQEKTAGIFTDTQSTLKQAIEDARSVDKIRAFADSILEISNMTNLLALNASIEAAHAGALGRGFGVVADEIKALAASSKNTVIKINETVDFVISSVWKLSNSTEALLEFVEKELNANYDTIQNVADQYTTDVQQFKDIILNLSGVFKQLKHSVDASVAAIDTIASSTSVSAESVQVLNKRFFAINETIKDVKVQADDSKQSSEQLLLEIKHFKV